MYLMLSVLLLASILSYLIYMGLGVTIAKSYAQNKKAQKQIHAKIEEELKNE